MLKYYIVVIFSLLFTFSVSAEQKELNITLDKLNKEFVKYLKSYPQCKNIKLTSVKLFNDGKNGFQEVKLSNISVDLITDITESGNLSNIKFYSATSSSDNNAFILMFCSSYAVMRALQPEYSIKEQTLQFNTELWKRAKKAPFEMIWITDRINAQYTPFQFDVYRK